MISCGFLAGVRIPVVAHPSLALRVLALPVLIGLGVALSTTASSVALAQSRATITKPDTLPPSPSRAAAPQRPGATAAAAADDDGADPADDNEGDAAAVTAPPARGPARPLGTTQPAGQSRPAAMTRRPQAPTQSAAADPAADPADADIDPDVGDGAQRLANRRPQDGDLAVPEPQAPRDGEITVEQPAPSTDGDIAATEDMAADASDAEDAPRESEQPGRPITPRRYGPYQPVGIRVGSFLLFPTIDAGMSSSDNIYRSASLRKGDMFSDVGAGARLSSNWSRHALELRAQGLGTFHDKYASEDDRRFEAQARARIDISRRTNLVGDLSYAYGQELRGTVNTPSATLLGERPDVITKRAAVEANHRVNRLTLQMRGAVTDNVYGTVPAIDPVSGATTEPVTAANERNYTQHEIGGRAGWQFSPNLTLYADTVLNSRRHEVMAADGISRDSEGYRTQGGVAIDVRGKLQGEASAGWGSQTPDDARLKSVSGFIYNGRMNWQPTGLTEVILEAKSDIAETTAQGSGGALVRQTSVEVRHALRRHLILIAGASYSVASYGGSSTQEKSLVEKVGFEYYLSRELALLAGYQHTQFETNSGRGYEDNTVRVGVRLRR